MALVVKRLEGETWKQTALRYAAKYGLAEEVAEAFDELVEGGTPADQAAWNACVEWDVAEFEVRGLPMHTYIVEALLPIPGVPSGCELLEAWTMKGARRKFRKHLAASGIPHPELLSLDVMEVVADADGEVEILAREIG